MECVCCMGWEGEKGLFAMHSSFSCLDHSMAMECVVHGCDVLNERGCACPIVLNGAHPSL